MSCAPGRAAGHLGPARGLRLGMGDAGSKPTVVPPTVVPPTASIALRCFGLLGGNIAAMTNVWDKHWKRVAVVATQGFFLSFGAKTLEREWYVANAHPVGASAGILGALAMSGITAFMWEHGKGFQSSGKEKHFAHDVEHTLAQVVLIWMSHLDRVVHAHDVEHTRAHWRPPPAPPLRVTCNAMCTAA